ncbi:MULTISPECIES: hypothetical protein [unclassified Massilia]|uniref:hypothetical protein n=1 Tax=unclassified Massilia TaxID=2609279 RepID=UPI001B822F22|nr:MULTISPECIES: hypothetical protein [unclassified Massilia]MBQ5942417.1 hypothetical protein [Massilia sp. AB1]MBQ5961570.1 hypothetical protein [Massilia sp. ZL223]
MWKWIMAAALLAAGAAAQAQPRELSPQQWHEDLRVLAESMPARHRNLYHTMTREQFAAAVASLDARIDTLPRHKIIVEMARIAAMAGDGHTNVAPTRDPQIGFRAFPLALYFFEDGLYVRAAAQQYRDLVGARVVGIGPYSTAQAYAGVREIIGRDNEQNALFFAPHLLVMPEILDALGMGEGPDRARLIVEQDGKRRVADLRDPLPAEMMPPDTDLSFMPRQGWTDARATTPLWLRDARSKFRMEHLAAGKILYVQLNQVGDEKNDTLAAFARRIEDAAARHKDAKIVLDLRLDRGGNGALVPPLIASLVRATPPGGEPRLFAITGRATFSAAQFVVNDLERYTDAVLVGEPTGGKANSYSDSRKIVLPHSGITVRVSTVWWQVDERDRREWSAPVLSVAQSFEDYRKGVDPALAAIQAYRPGPPLAGILSKAETAAAVRSGYSGWRAQPANRYADAQAAFQEAGYALLKQGKADAALAVFELWTTAHPAVGWGYEGQGAAYLAKGDRERAVEAYRRALKLEPSSGASADALAKLQAR